MKRAVIDYRTCAEVESELRLLGCDVIRTRPLSGLYDEIMGHADIQLHTISDKIICAPSVYGYYKSVFYDKEVVCGSLEPCLPYPKDIAYNVCNIGKYVICSKNHVAPEILTEYKNDGAIFLDVRQGYAKCNICIVNDESAITSDEGIYRELIKNRLNVLKIQSGYISLGNMQGFIGGASGLINKDTLAFCGDLSNHPDGENIKLFCRNIGVDTVKLKNGMLEDIGSIIFIRD